MAVVCVILLYVLVAYTGYPAKDQLIQMCNSLAMFLYFKLGVLMLPV